MLNSRPSLSIERIPMPSRATFEKEFLEPCRPVIITGAMSKWRALKLWNEEFFRRSDVSSRVVPIEKYPNGDRYNFPLWIVRPQNKMPLRDYMDLVLSDENRNYYCADQDIDWSLPELWADIEYPDLFDRSGLRRTTFYLGRDTISAAHYHPDTQVVLCQVVGRKRFVFWPPDDIDKLYPAPWYTPNFNWSRVNFDDPDVERRFPKIKEARRVECVVEPGEMIFVPIHWWHLVYGEGFSVSVTYIWQGRIRDWPSPRPALHTVASVLVNNPVVSRFVPREKLGARELAGEAR